MELNAATSILTALGHEGRLSVFRLMMRRFPDGVRPTEIAEALSLKPNTLSVYLSSLEQCGLVKSQREGRAIYYRAAIGQMNDFVEYLVADCCRGRPELCTPNNATGTSLFSRMDDHMTTDPYNVLFICTGNSARSIFAEALLQTHGGEKFRAYSAGTKPFSTLNPFAVEMLDRNGHDIGGLEAKNISVFQGDDAPQMDFVFTVCDSAANEECPPWEGQPLTAHWGLPDPVKVEGTDAEKSLAFANTYTMMRRQLEAIGVLMYMSTFRLKKPLMRSS